MGPQSSHPNLNFEVTCFVEKCPYELQLGKQRLEVNASLDEDFRANRTESFFKPDCLSEAHGSTWAQSVAIITNGPQSTVTRPDQMHDRPFPPAVHAVWSATD